MTIVNWWLSDPLFLSGVYRSQVEVDFFNIQNTTYKDSASWLPPCTEWKQKPRKILDCLSLF